MENDELYGKKIKTVEVDTTPNIGVDLDDEILQELVSGYSGISVQKIQQFTTISQRRDQLYDLLDTMCEDSQVAQALDIYVQCATERNDNGEIVWCSSDDPNIQRYITFLLDSLNVDKYIYKWVYCLAKYGDAYIQIFRESEMDNDIFKKRLKNSRDTLNEQFEKELNEDVIVRAFKNNDRYAHYVELHNNPAEMFELTRHGKTYGYVEAPVMVHHLQSNDQMLQSTSYQYKFKKQDVYLMGPDEFVHACLDNTGQRESESVNISDDETSAQYEYQVKRGKSILYNAFKAWRLLSLLEDSLMLNRLTKSSIVRIIGVKVGDMPKEEVPKHLYGVKQLIEQKSALNVGTSLDEYNNPGPIENFVITPIRDNDQGNIVATTIGGDVDVKGLADIDLFKNKFYGALGIPKQYMGDTDDAAGFDAGKSLSLISSVFAKSVKRIQSAMIDALTDMINLMLVDKGLLSYVNKFQIKMQSPTTQEEVDRVDSKSKQIDYLNSIMNLLSDVNSDTARLKIVKSLISDVVSDPQVLQVLQDYIDEIDNPQPEPSQESEEFMPEESENEDIEMNSSDLNSVASSGLGGAPAGGGEEPEEDNNLPEIPADIDMTDNTQF